MKDEQLSRNFRLSEFTRSSLASRHGIDNTPSQQQIDAMRWLCENFLQPLRDRFGRIRIESGFRNPEVNRLAGGARASQHMDGTTADFQPLDSDPKEVFRWLAKEKQLSFDQLIDQIDGKGTIHASYLHNRQEIMLYDAASGKYIPHPGPTLRNIG